jgi:hypothetical protein
MRLGKSNESDREGDGGEREKDKRKAMGRERRGVVQARNEEGKQMEGKGS